MNGIRHPAGPAGGSTRAAPSRRRARAGGAGRACMGLALALPVSPVEALLAAAPAPPAVHLAPPLPAPAPNMGLLLAALVVLGAAVVPIWLVARRLRRAPVPASGPVEEACRQLAAAAHGGGPQCGRRTPCGEPRPREVNGTAPGTGPCPVSATDPEGTACPCADAVRRILAEFVRAATGLPGPVLTTQELEACQGRLAEPAAAALERVTRVLEDCDRCRFEPARPSAGCLVDTAIAAVRAWPAGAGAPMPPQAAEGPA